MLRHPLCLSLIRYKWFKVGRKLYYFNLLFYISFLATLTAYTLTIPNPAEYPVSIFLLEKYHCKKQKTSRILWKKNVGYFQNFMEVEFCWRLFFFTLIIHKLPLGHVRSHKKFRPDRFNRFDVYWIQTNKQTSKVLK